MRKTLRGQFFVALEFWNFRRFHQVFSIFYGTIKPCRDGSRCVPKFWDQLLKLWDHLNFRQVFRIFLWNYNLVEVVIQKFRNLPKNLGTHLEPSRQGYRSSRKNKKPD